MENINIPIYRAKKIDSDEYVQGFLFKDTDGYFRITNGIKDYKHPLKLPFEYLIDTTTLAIHFPDMIDSQGNKIFASLSEKGGSLLQYKGTIYEVMYLNYLIQGVTNMHLIKSELFEYAKAIGIQK